jgi:hypothetical protein
MSIDTIIGIVLSVIGILTGYIFYIKGQRIKEAAWTIDNFILIKGYSSLVKDLDIKYRGKTIDDLTVTKVVFWNNGNDIIDGTDIKTALPLSIRAVDDTEILEVQILKVSNPANLFTSELEDNRKSARLIFDYLNSNEGAVIQVLHTGASLVNIIVWGEIKGVKELKYKSRERDNDTWITRLMYYSGNFIIWSPILTWILFPSLRGSFNIVAWVWIVCALLTTFLTVLYEVRRSRTVARLPKELS